MMQVSIVAFQRQEWRFVLVNGARLLFSPLLVVLVLLLDGRELVLQRFSCGRATINANENEGLLLA